jgi:hypothetical protein
MVRDLLNEKLLPSAVDFSLTVTQKQIRLDAGFMDHVEDEKISVSLIGDDGNRELHNSISIIEWKSTPGCR